MAAVTNPLSATPTSGGTATTNNQTSYTSGSFTPTAGAVLFIGAMVSGTTTAAPTCTASANGLTFTLITLARQNTSADRVYVFVSNQAVPASPSAMTVTVGGLAATPTGAVVTPLQVTGLSKVGTAAVKQSAISENNSSGVAPSTTFGSAAQTTNPILWIYSGTTTTGTNPPTGMTERCDVNYSTPAHSGATASRDSGFTGTVITHGTATGGIQAAIAIEVDASAAVTSASITPATETDAAQVLGRQKSRDLTVPTETDGAVALTRHIPLIFPITPAAETDTAVPLGRRKSRSITPATDSESTVTLARVKKRTLTPIGETDATVVLPRRKSRLITVTTETDSTVTIGRRKSRLVTPAGETDTAVVITRRSGVRNIVPGTETDTAVHLTGVKVRARSVVVETGTAVALTRKKSRTLTPATESDSAVTLTRRTTAAGGWGITF